MRSSELELTGSGANQMAFRDYSAAELTVDRPRSAAGLFGARGKGIATRVLDIVISLLLLPFILLILVPAMVALKVTSPGPVFFSQTRYGLNKQPFKIFKLRTMTVCEDGADFRQAVKGDARITPIGRILRASSGDELPQIFNVLKGDMSLVGPRPHATAHDDHFLPLIGGYDRRFGVRPGITGLAQVRGQRGPTETVDVMRARVESDIEYVERASLWFDLWILLRTAIVVLTRRNAF